MKTSDGRWEGISIELWQALARELDLEFELHEREREELLNQVARGELDAGVAALTITARRERRLDFTHAYHNAGTAIAVAVTAKGGGWLRVAERFVSAEFLVVVGLLTLLLLAAGTAVWLFERRDNREMFGRDASRGLGHGFWWAAVTMTTVGYGDKIPKTVGGRLVALIWMFTSIIVISSFTAAITTSLTVEQLSGNVRGPADLPTVRVGAVADTSSARSLARRGIAIDAFASSREGLQALREGRIDAFVHDEPILKHLARVAHRGEVRILAETFAPQEYGIALPTGSPLREPLNGVLLDHTESDDWFRLLERYLGPGA